MRAAHETRFSVADPTSDDGVVAICRMPGLAPRCQSLHCHTWRGGTKVGHEPLSGQVKAIHERPNGIGRADAWDRVFGRVEQCAGSKRVAIPVRVYVRLLGAVGVHTVEISSGLPWDTRPRWPLTWRVVVGWWVCPRHSSEWNRHGCRRGRCDKQFLEHVLLLWMIASTTAHMGIVVRARCDELSSGPLQSRPISARYHLVRKPPQGLQTGGTGPWGGPTAAGEGFRNPARTHLGAR